MQSSNIKQIVIDDHLMSYRVYDGNNIDAPIILFLHGWGSDSRIWHTLIQSIDSDFSIAYALDLPGFGDSENPHTPFSPDDYARIVKMFIERLNINNIIIVGHSYGGRVAARLSAGNSKAIKKTILIGASGIRHNKTALKGLGIVAKITKPFIPTKMKNTIYSRLGSDYTLRVDLEETFKKSLAIEDHGVYRDIKTQTLIVWGNDDSAVPLATGQQIHTLVPNSTFEIIYNAGHYCFLDNIPAFIEVFKKFIQS